MGGMIKCKLCKSQHMAAITDFLFPHQLLWQLMIKMFQRHPPKSQAEQPYYTSKEFTRKQQTEKLDSVTSNAPELRKTTT